MLLIEEIPRHLGERGAPDPLTAVVRPVDLDPELEHTRRQELRSVPAGLHLADEPAARFDREQQADRTLDPGPRRRDPRGQLFPRRPTAAVHAVVLRPSALDLDERFELGVAERSQQHAIALETDGHADEPPPHGGRKTLRSRTICPSRAPRASATPSRRSSSSSTLARSRSSSASISMMSFTPARLIPRSCVISWICFSRSMSRSE